MNWKNLFFGVWVKKMSTIQESFKSLLPKWYSEFTPENAQVLAIFPKTNFHQIFSILILARPLNFDFTQKWKETFFQQKVILFYENIFHSFLLHNSVIWVSWFDLSFCESVSVRIFPHPLQNWIFLKSMWVFFATKFYWPLSKLMS